MLRIELSVPDLSTLGPRWRALEARAAEPSFFQSWTWVGCELEARFHRPLLLAAADAGEEVGLALFNRRHGALWLHETGDPELDAPFIERNGMLLVAGYEDRLPDLLRALPRRLVLSGVEDALAHAARADRRRTVRQAQTRVAPVLDLRAPPLDQLSANTRGQVRRSMRRYEAAWGALALARADSAAQARAWLDELVVWHEATWRGRGKPGAFADPRILQFHRTLIDRCMDPGGMDPGGMDPGGVDPGEVDLLRVTAGARVVGLLYNLRRGHLAYAYQSGFDYAGPAAEQSGAQLKPGLTCHTMAAEWYRARGALSYDFLGGGDRYKRSLASREEALHWLTLVPRWSPAGLVARLRSGHDQTQPAAASGQIELPGRNSR